MKSEIGSTHDCLLSFYHPSSSQELEAERHVLHGSNQEQEFEGLALTSVNMRTSSTEGAQAALQERQGGNGVAFCGGGRLLLFAIN